MAFKRSGVQVPYPPLVELRFQFSLLLSSREPPRSMLSSSHSILGTRYYVLRTAYSVLGTAYLLLARPNQLRPVKAPAVAGA